MSKTKVITKAMRNQAFYTVYCECPNCGKKWNYLSTYKNNYVQEHGCGVEGCFTPSWEIKVLKIERKVRNGS